MRRPTPSTFGAALVATAFVLVLALYSRLADPMPTHWNLAGDSDGYTPKPFGPFILPLVMALVQLALQAVPHFMPGAFAEPTQRRLMGLVQVSIVGFLFVVTLTSLAAGLGIPVSFNRVLTPALGLFMIALGGMMRSLPRNAFIGIRTPWTLANDEVWRQTHAMGGRMFILAGLVALIGGGMGLDLIPVLVALGIAAVAPAVYSFRIYRKVAGMQAPK